MGTPWWISLGRVLWRIFSRLMPPLMAIGWPALAIYGTFAPRPPDLAALQLQPGESAVRVGVAAGGRHCVGAQPCDVPLPQRSYLVIPRVVSNASVFVVEDTQPERTVTELAWHGLLLFAIWILCLFGTWHYWVRPAWRLTVRWSGR